MVVIVQTGTFCSSNSPAFAPHPVVPVDHLNSGLESARRHELHIAFLVHFLLPDLMTHDCTTVAFFRICLRKHSDHGCPKLRTSNPDFRDHPLKLVCTRLNPVLHRVYGYQVAIF